MTSICASVVYETSSMLSLSYLREGSRKTKRKSLKTCRLHRCSFRDEFIAASLKRSAPLVRRRAFQTMSSDLTMLPTEDVWTVQTD
jgi:hypothetical protein